MKEARKTDAELRSWFRSGRFFRDGGKWYFNTREGTIEGPFEERTEAEDRLKEYIRIMNSGFMPRDSKLELEVLEIEEE
jgi:hypothetical protein